MPTWYSVEVCCFGESCPIKADPAATVHLYVELVGDCLGVCHCREYRALKAQYDDLMYSALMIEKLEQAIAAAYPDLEGQVAAWMTSFSGQDARRATAR